MLAALRKLFLAFWKPKQLATDPKKFETKELIDDPGIEDEDRLLRRINPEHHLVPDESGYGRRLSSGAFGDSSRGAKALSVSIEKFLNSPQDALRNYQGHFLVAFTAGFARGLTPKQGIAHTPTREDYSHGDVFGKKTGPVKDQLREEANKNWIVAPSDLAV